LLKGAVERPSDFEGVGYISLDDKDWQTQLRRELTAAGLQLQETSKRAPADKRRYGVENIRTKRRQAMPQRGQRGHFEPVEALCQMSAAPGCWFPGRWWCSQGRMVSCSSTVVVGVAVG